MGLLNGILKKKEWSIGAPAAGSCVSITQVPDPTFSEEILGKGVAIKPSEGRFYAPVDGSVTTLFPTLHAIGIRTKEGVDVLLHVGLETVRLNGKGFTAHVEQGDEVKKGDLLLEVDLEAIEAAGCDTITPVLICNTNEFKEVLPAEEKEVTPGDEILRIRA